MQNKKCEVCGTEIVLLKSEKRNRVYTKKYCSSKCVAKGNFQNHHDYYKTYWESKYRGLIQKKCEFCGNTFPSKKDSNLTCSKRCSKKLWKKKNWEKVLSDQRAWFKRKRVEQPERFRFYVKNRSHMIRESSGSTKRFSKAFTLLEWETIKENQGGKCNDCHEVKKLTMDHIHPLSKSGAHNKENIQGLCHSCNSRKKDKIVSVLHTSQINS
jgi:HNH endonuclease